MSSETVPTLEPPACLREVTAEAWEGGGFLGVAYAPCIARLDSYGLRITDHAGTSAGAITALLRALAYTPAQIQELLETTPWRSFARYRVGALYRLWRSRGWFPIDFARGWIEDRIARAGVPPFISFAGLERQTGHRLWVVTTRYARKTSTSDTIVAESYRFGPHTPDASVAEAVLASMAVPLFWPPVEVEGFWHSDGGVACNHPLEVFAGRRPETFIGFRLDSERELAGHNISSRSVKPSLAGMLSALASMMIREANRAHVVEELWPRVVQIETGSEPALDFRAGEGRLRFLRDAGAAGFDRWLAKQEDPRSDAEGKATPA